PLAALAPTPSQATTPPDSTSAPDDAVEPSPAADVGSAAMEEPVAAASPPPLPVLERPVRILVAGDSTAEATGAGLINWAAERPDLAQAELFTVPGCGFMTGGTYVLGDSELEVAEGCTNYVDVAIGEAARDRQVDVVMLMTTAWDVQDRMWEDGLAGSVLDDAVAARLRDDMTALTESILAVGAGSVAWIRGPISDVGWGDDVGPQEDPARHAVIYAVIDELAERYPARVHMIDLPTFVDEAGLAEDRDARPDGVHWTPEAATYIATWYLGEQLIRSALDLQPR
ncbi:MAG: SGNH hydrolase domain-containing protein, partial [Acidimicrobiia bacterium]|nr:SGNH hydrolase domain-containing protein [Acidimicrobiia bacterium]